MNMIEKCFLVQQMNGYRNTMLRLILRVIAFLVPSQKLKKERAKSKWMFLHTTISGFVTLTSSYSILNFGVTFNFE